MLFYSQQIDNLICIFESLQTETKATITNGSIAQLGEHLPYKQRVIGSSPIVPTTFGPVVQLVRTLACHARGRRFEPVPGRQFFASVAQSVEQGTENPRVDGSIPSGGTKNADVAHLVERHLAKVEVAGSSPVIRSKTKALVLYKCFYFWLKVVYGDVWNMVYSKG